MSEYVKEQRPEFMFGNPWQEGFSSVRLISATVFDVFAIATFDVFARP